MFHIISWQQYFFFILTCMVVYYLVILFCFYRKELLHVSINKPRLFKQALQPAKNTLSNIHTTNEKPASVISDNESVKDILFPMVHELLTDLDQIFHNAEEQGYPKEELYFSIQKTLKQYRRLDKSEFQVSINNYITEECKNKCSILLSEDEVKTLWVQ